jgi:hypothetical protein
MTPPRTGRLGRIGLALSAAALAAATALPNAAPAPAAQNQAMREIVHIQ